MRSRASCPAWSPTTGGFDDKSFNQLGVRGPRARRRGARASSSSRSSPTPTSDFAPNITEPGRPELHAHRHGRLRPRARPQSRPQRPTPTSSSSRSTTHRVDDRTSTATTDAPNIKPIIFDTAQAAFLAGYASASYSHGQERRHVRRHELPDRRRSSWTASRRASSTGTSRRATPSRCSAGIAHAGRCLHRWLRRRPGRDQRRAGPRRPGRWTCCCPSVARSTRAPRRSSATPASDIALLGVDADVFETDPTVGRPAADLDPQGRSTSASRRRSSPPAQGDFDTDAVHRHARERGRGPRPVPRLRDEGLARPAGASSTRSWPASSTDRSPSSRTSRAESRCATGRPGRPASPLPCCRMHRAARHASGALAHSLGSAP